MEEGYLGVAGVGKPYPSVSGNKNSQAADDEAINSFPNYSVNMNGNKGDVLDVVTNASPNEGVMEEPEVVGPDAEEPAEEGTEKTPSSVNPPEFAENPFVKTADEKISTFSADVDTASYAYFRKLVNAGYSFNDLRYSGATFRTEEFINYFRYTVKAPTESELFGVSTSIIPCPWNNESMLLRVTMQAEEAINDKGNNLVFLIDVSGSMMSYDKLPLLKCAFTYLVDNLTEKDTISIGTYSGREQVVLEGCSGNKKAEILNAINSLKASGSTNGEAGLKKAYQIAESYMIEGGNNRIIMASDGDLNVGISSIEELKSFVADKRDQGVYLSVLGFGSGNYRDAKMEAIADNGNGIYYYIDGESEAEKVFATDLLGTLYTVAEDVKLQLEFNPELVSEYRLIGYENRVMANEDFANDKKDAGEVGASHQVTVCYEIKPAAIVSEKGPENPFVTLRVRYKNPGETLSHLNEYYVTNIESRADEDEKF
ncbi:MAG: von Willebrand factor type A domain-containing protein, partial [Clostridia bacterium]|nr:von Willebrand factor type A domain-containing protein [Clostridia bacterium]